MRTEGVQESDDGTGQYLHVDGWTPWQYHLPEAELNRYYEAANALMMKFDRMPPGVRSRLERIEIRCPERGCLLTTVYRIPRRPTPEEVEHDRHLVSLRDANGQPAYTGRYQPGHYLYVGRTAGGIEVYDILNYPYSSLTDGRRRCSCCRILYWRAGCRHGTASIDRHYIYDLFSVAARVVGPSQDEDRAISGLPDHLKKFWGKRVFHPHPEAWHPKQRSSGRVSASNVRMRARAAKGM